MNRDTNETRRYKYITAAGIFLFVLGWMLYCAAPTIYWGDSAEMTSVACSAGVAHSPGYPLFSLVAGIFLWLPAQAGFAANCMSVFFSAAAAALMFYFLTLVTKRLFSAAAGAIFLFCVPEFLRESLYIEVYALHIFLFCAVLYCVAAYEADKDQRWFFGALMFLGLGMAHHILMYFVMAAFLLYCMINRGHAARVTAVPLMLFFAYMFMNLLMSHNLGEVFIVVFKWALAGAAALYVLYLAMLAWRAREAFGYSMRTLTAGVFIFAASVWVFAYLPLASARRPAADWWSPDTPGNFLSLLFLKGYPPTFPTAGELAQRVDLAGFAQNLPLDMVAVGLRKIFGAPPDAALLVAIYATLIIIGIGLAVMLRGRARFALMLLLIGVATFFGGVLVSHGKPEALRLPVYLVAIVFIIAMADAVLDWCQRRGGSWRWILSAPVCMAVAALAVVGLSRADFRMMANSAGAYQLGEGIINDASPDSLLFIGEQAPGIMGYFQACEPEKLRKKRIVVVPLSFLAFDWKLEQLRAAYPLVRFPWMKRKQDEENEESIFTAEGAGRVRYATELIRANPRARDVFTDYPFLPISYGYITIPHGMIYRVAGCEHFTDIDVMKMFDSDVAPKWPGFDKRDSVSAENIASVHNERGTIFLRYGEMFATKPEGVSCFDFARERFSDARLAEYWRGKKECKVFGLLRAACSEFDLAAALNPRYADALSNRGMCKILNGDIDAGLKMQRDSTKLKPNDPELYNALARTLLRLPDEKYVGEAVSLLNKSLDIDRKQSRVYFNLGVAYTKLGDLTNAVKSYEKSIELDRNYVEAYRNLSGLYYYAGGCGDAKSLSYLDMAVDKARELDEAGRREDDMRAGPRTCTWKSLFPQVVEGANPELLDLRAEQLERNVACGYTRTFNQEIGNLYREYCPMPPCDLNFYQTMGVIFRNIGRLDGAMKVYQEAVKYYPDYKLDNLFISITPNLAFMTPDDKDCGKAVGTLSQVIRMAPRDVGVRLHLASVLFHCGQMSACERLLRDTKTIAPNDKGVDTLLQQLQEAKQQQIEKMIKGQ